MEDKSKQPIKPEQSPLGMLGIIEVYTKEKDKEKLADSSVKNKNSYKPEFPFIAVFKTIKKYYKFEIFSSILLFILASYYVEQDKIFDFLVKINEMALNLLPNLLGFNLGAYTLFITFGGSEFLKKIVGFKEGNYSFYQKNSAIFAITLIIQLFSLIYSYIVSIFLELKIPGILPQLEPIVNYAVLLFTILFSLSSITIIKAIIVNLFNISQMYHIVIFKDNFTSNDSKSEN